MNFQDIFVALAQFSIFLVFITAIIEVIKNVAAQGVWSMVKELLVSLWKNSPLSPGSIKTLNFCIALLFAKVFNYGVMTRLLQLNFQGDMSSFAYLLDYIGTASLAFMGAGWVYDQFSAIQNKFTTTSATTTSTEIK